MLIAVSLTLIVFSIIWAWMKFSKKPEMEEAQGLGKVLANKWYVDELYDLIVSKPLKSLGAVLNRFIEKSAIDGLVNGAGKIVMWGGRQLRLLQSGQVGSYVLWMVLSILILIVITLFI
jgi:NADH-quinone oxidoreductase subunit L